MRGTWFLDYTHFKLYLSKEQIDFLQGKELTFELVAEDVNKASKLAGVDSWIDQWRELFPRAKNNGGYSYRGDREECLKKMQKFVEKYPFTKEQIFEATKRAVEAESRNGYQYLPLAHYFIHKQDAGSKLAMVCEALGESVDRPVVRT